MEDVLIIGGRTTGLMLAIELARRKVAVRIIDRSPGIDPHVRANLIHSRTLEILHGLGLSERVTRGSIAEKGTRVYANGELKGETLHAPIDSSFPFGMSQSQATTEAVLEAHLQSLGVFVERSVELLALDLQEDRVVATLRSPHAGETVVEASWLVGCDGAHSSVRNLTNTTFPGDSDPYPYVLADVVLDGDLAVDEGHIFLHEEGDLFVFSSLPEGRRLICANLPIGTDPTRPPDLDEIQELVTRRGLPHLRVSDPRWLTRFRIRYRLAPHYRQGRAFLAGDAAHIHSLLAGQGMNTGIQDAFNLGWKLALVIQGRAPASLLESYEIERRKVAEEVVAMTRTATEGAELFASLSKSKRAQFTAHRFVPEAEKMKAARHLQEVDLDYRASPLSLEPTGDFEGGPHAGTQAPDAAPIEVDGETTSLYAWPLSANHRLLLFTGFDGSSGDRPFAEDLFTAARQAAKRQIDWIDVVIVASGDFERAAELAAPITVIKDLEQTMHTRYAAEKPCLYLIRPDGYISYRCHRLDSLDTYLDRFLSRDRR